MRCKATIKALTSDLNKERLDCRQLRKSLQDSRSATAVSDSKTSELSQALQEIERRYRETEEDKTKSLQELEQLRSEYDDTKRKLTDSENESILQTQEK